MVEDLKYILNYLRGPGELFVSKLDLCTYLEFDVGTDDYINYFLHPRPFSLKDPSLSFLLIRAYTNYSNKCISKKSSSITF